jgi:hypothetical protein
MHIKDYSSKHTKSLSGELRDLAEEFKHHAVPLRDVIAVLQERAYTLLMIMLALPFCAPVSIPGLSTPLGLVIALVAARYALGLPPWLPERLLKVELPPKFFGTLLAVAGKVIGFLERVLVQRWRWMTSTPLLLRLHAVMICLAAITLLIPAPVPFSNLFPALGVLLGAAGVMERDGFAVFCGYCFMVIGIAYFALVAVFGVQIIEFLHDKVLGR